MYSPDLDRSSTASNFQSSSSNGLAVGASDPIERKADVIAKIQALVPIGAPEPTDPDLLQQLRDLTQRLIRAYKNEGCLQGDPFYDAWTRNIHLYEDDARLELKDKRVLITGGEGYVGRHLLEAVARLGAARIVSVDKERCSDATTEVKPLDEGVMGDTAIAHYAVDMRDATSLEQVFAAEKPEVVFHLAAQRLPGLAEVQIHETVTSNIFGTRNLIRMCEAYGVKKCVFSSTGKASRYYTAEVYAASKKLCEWQFAHASEHGTVTYAMVRFTHMLNNSSFCEQFDTKISQNRPINVHAPNRFIVGQNIGEAVHLLLNALVFAEPKKLKFVLCRNLGWPTETLEVALHKILESGKDLCIYFQGILPGYEEPLFRGQIDWDNPSELNTLINAAEILSRHYDPVGHMLVAELTPFCYDTLFDQLAQIEASTLDPALPQAEIKKVTGEAVLAIATTSFANVPPEVIIKILKWGMNPQYFQEEKIPPDVLQNIVNAMIQGLNQGLNNTLNRCVDLVSRHYAPKAI
ncbi:MULTISPECIES: polysaccharide biosynthesis protein [unclassified Leptolyngbya]|uniref:polysaccharide biosynthesis protein n=1 Tax=unclassified Leptolyngbya TaxID=2650499 RepID=UPI001686E6E9|nr:MULTISPECIES: polysaccharide biosynthesis protein [unclassified Leptolyngbya]MBD1909618.1 polysaccharide biosynthesis protein [Leptolyngbya sp. FACHB-8]MBD2154156.1 polysaccharide biosynthesis protein [Leptolyngbya sp. FACHB-16]